MDIGGYQRIKKGSLQLWTSLMGLLFPPVCVVCGKSLVQSERYICTACLADFPFSDEAYASGESVLDGFEAGYRPECLHSLFYYNKFSHYKQLIYLVKYRSHRELGVYLGRLLGMKIAATCQADCIVPIPLHPQREKERGFNQALEIARGIEEVLHIAILKDVVIRTRNNASQTGKNAGERQKNVENIFELRCPQQIRGHHVLLVDDVITTGATIGACLRVLAQAGEVKFSLGCLAQTV